MWNRATAENLRAKLDALYERLADYYASGNLKMYDALGDVRRVELALDRLTFGRIR
jgi:hypothetical protein